MSTIPRRNHLKTDSRDREATRTMGASRDFTTGIDTGAPTALRERPSTKRAPSRTRVPHRSTKRLGSKQVVSFRGRQLQPQTKKNGLLTRLGVISLTLLIVGVALAMWLSGLSTKQTFAIQQLTVQDSQLDNQIETLNRDAENLSSSADIARRADEMGMAIPKQPGIAEVGGDGKIVDKREGTPDTEKLIDVNGEPIRPGQASSDPKDTEGMSDSLNAVPQGQQRTSNGGDAGDRNSDRETGDAGAAQDNARPNLPARAPYASRAEQLEKNNR